MCEGPLSSSFRDPSGFLFIHEGRLYRQVNRRYLEDYRRLQESGLYGALVDKGLLIPHTEASLQLARSSEAVAILEPELVPFISYPYEWSFSQLRDAALLTLQVQDLALGSGMILKDASAYNVQFRQGRPVLIDSLSFTTYRDGEPWVAYRQFCQHFLAPLALMARVDIRLGSLLREHIDGIPLDLASRLLPGGTKLNAGLLMHIHAHAASQRKHADRRASGSAVKVSRRALLGIVDSLRQTAKGLSWRPRGTEWGDYYHDTNYSDSSLGHKRELVGSFLDQTGGRVVWDLGANNGFFSRAATERGLLTIAADVDPAAVEQNWLECRQGRQPLMLPLLLDLTNPSPGLGWAHAERMSLIERGPADVVLALALVHHLAISNNVPLDRLAHFFASIAEHLIIEFVPKEDSQVQRLLATRQDIFTDYHLAGFKSAFSARFDLLKEAPIAGSARTLCLMRRRHAA